jgi:hypothetical protein
VRTRKIYPAGIEKDSYGERVLVLYSPYGANSVTASCTPIAGSTTVTSSAAFGSVLVGMHISGTGYDPGTIVLSKADSSHITLSRAANTDAVAGTATFSTGTIAVTIRGSGVSENVLGLQTVYNDMRVGDLFDMHAPEIHQGFELQFEKVPLTFDGNHDSATWASLAVAMRLHQFTYLVKAAGLNQNRATN